MGFLIPELSNTLGYLKVNNDNGASNSEQALSFTPEIQDQIIAYDNSEITAWIFDLSGNVGGNMWLMFTGTRPVLEDGIAGYFSYPEESLIPWSYEAGVSRIDEAIIM
jgi:hypothetical protein